MLYTIKSWSSLLTKKFLLPSIVRRVIRKTNLARGCCLGVLHHNACSNPDVATAVSSDMALDQYFTHVTDEKLIFLYIYIYTLHKCDTEKSVW